MRDFAADFNQDKENIYLNSGTLSKLPKVVLEALVENTKDYEVNPTFSLFTGWQRLWQTQKKMAQFFKAAPEDLFFRANVTAAMNDFLLGVQISDGEILITDMEYGAMVNICQLRAKRDNRTLRTIHLPVGDQIKSEEDCVTKIVSQFSLNTRLLMISHVMTGTGLKIPLQKLAVETRKRNILLVVDGAHGPGAISLDFHELENVDFYGGNFHKWLMAPKGTGFGWVPKRNQNKLEPLQGSWTVLETHPSFDDFGEGHRFALQMLTSNCLDFANFFTLDNVFNYWNECGEQEILAKIYFLRNHAEALGKKILSVPMISPTVPELKSPLLSFELPKKYSNKGPELMQLFFEKYHLTLAFPKFGSSTLVRFSSHIYNTEAEIEFAMKTLKQELF